MGTQDVYEGVTAAIVSAIEAGAGSWVMPWRQSLPVNAITRKPYRGGNTCVLWFAAADKGFDSEEWATYRQWASVDAQVRKGERGTACLFFSPAGTKTVAVSDDDESETRTVGRRAVAKVFWVFNAAQVDGYEAKRRSPRSCLSLSGWPARSASSRALAPRSPPAPRAGLATPVWLMKSSSPTFRASGQVRTTTPRRHTSMLTGPATSPDLTGNTASVSGTTLTLWKN